MIYKQSNNTNTDVYIFKHKHNVICQPNVKGNYKSDLICVYCLELT